MATDEKKVEGSEDEPSENDDESTETSADDEASEETPTTPTGPANATTEGGTQVEGDTTPADTADTPHPVVLVPGGAPGAVAAEDQTRFEGEHLPPITGETWVVLAQDDSVPERYWGSIAAVIDPIPVGRETDPVSGQVVEFLHPDSQLHVRERSQGAELWIPLSGVQRMSLTGRVGVNKGT